MTDGPPRTFDEAWDRYGGYWVITRWDGAVFSGFKPPARPKLRVIEGGKK